MSADEAAPSTSQPLAADFKRENYLSLRTWRMSGKPVDTPMWFVEQDDLLYVFSSGEAGKVKRLRRDSRSAFAPCSVSGKLRGPWLEAQTTRVEEAQEIAQIVALLRKKYGALYAATHFLARLGGRLNKRAYYQIRPIQPLPPGAEERGET